MSKPEQPATPGAPSTTPAAPAASSPPAVPSEAPPVLSEAPPGVHPAAAAAAAAADAKPVLSLGQEASRTAGQWAKKKEPLPPLTGVRAVFEHTGIPRSVLTWKPKIPGRKWLIFYATVATFTSLYYYDRNECKRIRKESIDKVSHLANEPLRSSSDMVRKVKVYGSRWPDDEEGRALQYFRKYVKPYLVAAAIDYEQVHAPLHGSVARLVRAEVLRKRREAIGITEDNGPWNPATVDPEVVKARELEGGIILVGRPTVKEFLAGLRAGWSNGVGPWKWETDVEKEIVNDGVFDEPVAEVEAAEVEVEATAPAAAPPAVPTHKPTLGFLARPSAVPPPQPGANGEAAPQVIPEHLHAMPAQLPPMPPVLLVPFVNYLGFLQVPYMMYNFFTERFRVKAGADAALALIQNQTRELRGPASDQPDTDFGESTERFYKKNFYKLPKKQDEARAVYYKELAPRLESARQFARGERDLTPEEKKSDNPIVTEDALREERRKKELRWHGQEEGYEIIKPETPVAWMPEWDGWLRIYSADAPQDLDQ